MSSVAGFQAWLIYDGDCPFCASYVRYIRVRESVGHLNLINARDGGSLVEETAAQGFDVNKGMVLKYGGRIYHGTDCIHMLALLSSSNGAFNKLNALIFRSPLRSRVIYPIMRCGRNLILRLLGRDPISRAI